MGVNNRSRHKILSLVHTRSGDSTAPDPPRLFESSRVVMGYVLIPDADHVPIRTQRPALVLIIVAAASFGAISQLQRTPFTTGDASAPVVAGPAASPRLVVNNPRAMRLDIKVVSEYGDSANITGRRHYSWLAESHLLVEPHKPATFTVVVADGSLPLATDRITWTLVNGATGEPLSADVASERFVNGSFVDVANNSDVHPSGTVVTAACTAHGESFVAIEAVNVEGKPLARDVHTTYCTYVKRDIRFLSLNDRNRFLDAAAAMWRTPNTTVGRAMYHAGGRLFTGIGDYVSAHANLATGSVWCDHMHDGTGFLTRHLALTWSFQESMRAVDPSVSLPYVPPRAHPLPRSSSPLRSATRTLSQCATAAAGIGIFRSTARRLRGSTRAARRDRARTGLGRSRRGSSRRTFSGRSTPHRA